MRVVERRDQPNQVHRSGEHDERVEELVRGAPDVEGAGAGAFGEAGLGVVSYGKGIGVKLRGKGLVVCMC